MTLKERLTNKLLFFLKRSKGGLDGGLVLTDSKYELPTVQCQKLYIITVRKFQSVYLNPIKINMFCR